MKQIKPIRDGFEQLKWTQPLQININHFEQFIHSSNSLKQHQKATRPGDFLRAARRTATRSGHVSATSNDIQWPNIPGKVDLCQSSIVVKCWIYCCVSYIYIHIYTHIYICIYIYTYEIADATNFWSVNVNYMKNLYIYIHHQLHDIDKSYLVMLVIEDEWYWCISVLVVSL